MRHSLFASLNYTLQASRRQYRGFDGAGFGDPRVVEWAPSQSDARHVVVLTGGMRGDKLGVLTLFARAQSGLPFTPVVQGDVNGDGRVVRSRVHPESGARERSGARRRPALVDGRRLAERTNAVSRRISDEVAERNGCRGPWTQSLNVQWRPAMPRRWGGRVTPAVYLQNVLAGVDQLVHGNSGLRGWGSPASPDPVLFVPRGLRRGSAALPLRREPALRRHAPESHAVSRAVPDRDRLLAPAVHRLLAAAASPRGRAGEDARGLAASVGGLDRRVLPAEQLERAQGAARRDGLAVPEPRAGRGAADGGLGVLGSRARSVLRELGEYLARGNGAAGKAEMDSASKSQKTYWRIFWEQPEIADSIVTPTQKELFPMLRRMVDDAEEGARAQPVAVRALGADGAASGCDREGAATPSGAPSGTEVRSRAKP